MVDNSTNQVTTNKPDMLVWSSKKSDGWIVIGYFILLIAAYHTISSIPRHRHNQRQVTFQENFTSLNHLLLSGAILLVISAPIVAFKRRVPNQMSFDREEKLFTIKSKHKKKDIHLSLDRMYYFHEENLLYSVLELYVDIELPSGKILNKRARTILIPNWGMSFTAKTLTEIVQELQRENVPVKVGLPKRGFWELMEE